MANLLAVWRVHGLDDDPPPGLGGRAWCWPGSRPGRSAGTSAAPPTPSAPSCAPVTNGLGLLPYGNGVHYDSEARRRPLVHQLVADGTLPTTHCTDDGVGLVYRGTELVEAVSRGRRQGRYVVRGRATGRRGAAGAAASA